MYLSQTFKEQAKDLNRYTKEDKLMANKLMKQCSIRELQIKMMIQYYALIRVAKMQSTDNT